MKKNIGNTLFSIIVICVPLSPIALNASPTSTGHLDREHKTPAFFSDQYDEYWKQCDKNNVTLLNDIKNIDEAPHQSKDAKNKGDKS